MTNSPPRLPTLGTLFDDFAAAPFRLLFLSACVAGIIAALCWSMATLGYWSLTIDPLSLHAFLFLQSFSGVAFSGFLLTAVPEWTHYTAKLTRQVQGLWLIWLLANIAVLFSLLLALAIMLLLWLLLCALVAYILWQKKGDKHISVLAWISTYTAMTTYIFIYAWQNGTVLPFFWQQLVHITVMGIALISFRIARALGAQALEDGEQDNSVFVPNPFYKNLAVWLFYLLVIHNFIIQNSVVEGWLNLAVAGVMIGRLREWHFFILLKRHYIRWLYLTIFIIGMGYGWRGLALIGISESQLFNPILPFHLITIGGFLLMAYQVFHIAGLRHSNRPLIYRPISRLAMTSVLLAALSRSLGVGLNGDYLWFAIYLPGLLLSLAFLIYLPVFYRLFKQYPASVPSEE